MFIDIGLVWFLYFMAYQPSWIILCQTNPSIQSSGAAEYTDTTSTEE